MLKPAEPVLVIQPAMDQQVMAQEVQLAEMLKQAEQVRAIQPAMDQLAPKAVKVLAAMVLVELEP
jgi:hypothetical protein